jgi:hypothetical protein
MAALGQIAAGQQEQMAKAAGTVDEQSQRVAQQRFADVMNRLATKRAEAMQTGAVVGQAAQTYGAETAAAAKTLREKRLAERAETAAGLGTTYGIPAGMTAEEYQKLTPQQRAMSTLLSGV